MPSAFDNRLTKLETTSKVSPPREDIEIEFVDEDGTVNDRLVIVCGNQSAAQMDLRKSSI